MSFSYENHKLCQKILYRGKNIFWKLCLPAYNSQSACSTRSTLSSVEFEVMNDSKLVHPRNRTVDKIVNIAFPDML